MQPFCFQSIPLFSYAVSSSTLNMTDCNTVNSSVVKSHRETESHLLSPCSNIIRLVGKKKEKKKSKKKKSNETASSTHHPKSPGIHLGISNDVRNLLSQMSCLYGYL